MDLLEINNLWVNTHDNKEILKGLNFKVNKGEVHALMGPNGSGKSTLAFAVAGHPKYTVTKGEVLLNGENILNLKPHQRASKGVFLAFQYPVAIPGVTVSNFLRHALKALGRESELKDFRKTVKAKLAELKIDESFMSRNINEGFSGGEKKRLEVLQLAILKPKLALMDETDSGLDIDALKIVASGIERFAQESEAGVVLITHYQRLLNFVKPRFVHILAEGKIVASGDTRLVEQLEREGYEKFVTKAPTPA
ncbi:MAG: Fe-S cluster assembly ATPase SufC [Elusimicrobia bacterium]|nr:Fe-S cluster assembly ATPase SufC [Elusimicrobiota bacterium]